MQLDTFDKLLAHELKDLWSAGTQLKAFLPTLTDAAQDADLIAHLNGLREQTKQQVENPSPTTPSSVPAATSAGVWRAW